MPQVTGAGRLWCWFVPPGTGLICSVQEVREQVPGQAEGRSALAQRLDPPHYQMRYQAEPAPRPALNSWSGLVAKLLGRPLQAGADLAALGDHHDRGLGEQLVQERDGQRR